MLPYKQRHCARKLRLRQIYCRISRGNFVMSYHLESCHTRWSYQMTHLVLTRFGVHFLFFGGINLEAFDFEQIYILYICTDIYAVVVSRMLFLSEIKYSCIFSIFSDEPGFIESYTTRVIDLSVRVFWSGYMPTYIYISTYIYSIHIDMLYVYAVKKERSVCCIYSIHIDICPESYSFTLVMVIFVIWYIYTSFSFNTLSYQC